MPEISEFVDPAVPPSGSGCVECDATGGWWIHLRRCALCGHVGCCDDSPSKHATAHYESTGHRVMQSYEPGEEWLWDYGSNEYVTEAPALAPPDSRPLGQPVPGPEGRVPSDWRERLG